jgi:hypothetical protein
MDKNLPKCKLVGTDGNVFSIIGKVSATLKKAGKVAGAKEFTEKYEDYKFDGDYYDLVDVKEKVHLLFI